LTSTTGVGDTKPNMEKPDKLNARARRSQRKAELGPSIRKRFVPRFWEDTDGRCSVIKLIRQRYENLKDDTGADTLQKDLLCQRATFISLQLETMEIDATNGDPFDAGVYGQLTNSLIAILKSLGLERKTKVQSLRAYVTNREA
jgi:hypothetical protein